MTRKRRFPIVLAYVLSLAVTIGLLVTWVVYVSTVARARALAGRIGVTGEYGHWWILAIGCALFFFLIAGLTWQLAQALAARRYSLKQEEFVSNVTHELKSPLAAIKLHAQTLQDEGLPREQQRRSLERVLQQADRMGRLVDDVLESSRLLGAHRRPLALAPVDVAAFFARYLPGAAERAEAQHVHLAWTLDSRAAVLATPHALDRVMDNLLDNAARFSPRGGEVRCRVRDDGDRVRIEVEDDGVGIPLGELGKVFDRFYQADNAEPGRRRGTGLGLSIVAGLVAEMKGRVEAFSQEGRPGTRFVVDLPALDGFAPGSKA